MQNRKFKKLSTFIAVTMLSVATVGTTAFANNRSYASTK